MLLRAVESEKESRVVKGRGSGEIMKIYGKQWKGIWGNNENLVKSNENGGKVFAK